MRHVSPRSVEAGEEIERRRVEVVVGPVAMSPSGQVIGATHGHGRPEHVGVTAEHLERPERPDGRTGRDDLDVAGPAILADRGHDLIADCLVEPVLQPHAVAGIVSAQPRPARDAVDRIDLDASGIDETAEGTDQPAALDLPGVAAGRWEDEHRCAPLPPSDHIDPLADPARVPGLVERHVPSSRRSRSVRRQNWTSPQKCSVNRFTSPGGKRAATLRCTATRARSSPKYARATSSRSPR